MGNATADATVTSLGEQSAQSPLPATRTRRMRGPPRGPVRTREPPQNQFWLNTRGREPAVGSPGSEVANLGESDSGRPSWAWPAFPVFIRGQLKAGRVTGITELPLYFLQRVLAFLAVIYSFFLFLSGKFSLPKYCITHVPLFFFNILDCLQREMLKMKFHFKNHFFFSFLPLW